VPLTSSLLAISDRATLPVPLEDWLRALAAAGIGAVQLREKNLGDRDLYELAVSARTALPPPIRLLVNSRFDVALAAGADGVHLPADGLPAAPLRARYGRGLLVGRSTHRTEEVERARDEGVDYVTFGPVYATPGKGAPVGLGELARAAAAGVPVYALGGVTLERFKELAEAGAAGIAAIRLFQNTRDLQQVVRVAMRYFCRTMEGEHAT
jgi:thiamine-phosphate pyrophosphorylase